MPSFSFLLPTCRTLAVFLVLEQLRVTNQILVVSSTEVSSIFFAPCIHSHGLRAFRYSLGDTLPCKVLIFAVPVIPASVKAEVLVAGNLVNHIQDSLYCPSKNENVPFGPQTAQV